MKIKLTFLAILFTGIALSQNYSKVKIYTDYEGLETLTQLGLAVDHGVRKNNTFIISDFSEHEIQLLDDNGFNYEILIQDTKTYYAKRNLVGHVEKNTSCAVNSTPLPNPPAHYFENNAYAGFYKYQDMLNALDSMANAYPNLITIKAPISTFLTFEGRPIFHVKISDDPNTNDGSEPKVLYTSIHHAREPMSMSQLIFYMWYLLENYNSDPEIQYLVDNNEMYFVPCLNPDGYLHNEANDPSGFGMHRKNKAPFGSFNPGVDLNRNYSYGWNTTGVSPNVNNDTYPGTSAFSESETQAINWLVDQVGFKTSLNAHSHGNLMLFPIGTTVAEFADHHDYFSDLATHMCSINSYFPTKASGLYAASGDSDDYMYKDGIGSLLHDTIFAMTPEIGTDFWPAQSEILPTCQGMIFPNMMMAHVTHKYLSVSDTDPLYIETLTGNFNHIAQRLGFESGVINVSADPVLNIQSLGAPITYNLGIGQAVAGVFSFMLNPAIQFADEIKYVIHTDYGAWVKHDTITKLYGQLALQLSDDASTSNNWTGTWTTTTDDSYSPSTSFTESSGGDYSNNVDESYMLIQSVDLTSANAAIVSFYAKWAIESSYDYCQFQVSTDGGSTWQGQCALYTNEGTSANGSAQPNGQPVWDGGSDWVYEEVNLSDYLGQIVKLRFRFESDGGVSDDGFYFDDFKISTNNPLSLKEEHFEVKAIPNPANDQFILSSSKIITGGSVQVYDQMGDILINQLILESTNEITIETSNLSAGSYTVRIVGNDGFGKPAKLIVIHN